MKITQKIKNGFWSVKIDLTGHTFTDGNGPFYISGSFNNWNRTDDKYRISGFAPPRVNNLSSTIVNLPLSQDRIEFKIFENGHRCWVEPITSYSSGFFVHEYYRYNEFDYIKNIYGTYNVLVIRRV